MRKSILKRGVTLGMAAALSCGVLGSPEMISGLKENAFITAIAAEASGSCGTNLNWSVSGETLTISGTGTKMKDYSKSGKAPWYQYRNEIKNLRLPSTLQQLGSYAFYNMDQLRYITTQEGTKRIACLPPSLKKIGADCFFSCDSLVGRGNGILNFGTTSNRLKNDLQIGTYAFACCNSVRTINIYGGDEKKVDIEQQAFSSMYNLETLNLDVKNLEIESVAFNNDYSLSKLIIDTSASINTSAFNGTPYRPYAVAVGHTSDKPYDPNKGWPEKIGAYCNRERVVRGIAPMKYSPLLAQAAQIRADELPTKYSHTRPDGSSFSTVFEDLLGANLFAVKGENIAAGHDSAWDVMYCRPDGIADDGYPVGGGWMYSFGHVVDGVLHPGHRANILDPDYCFIGCGVTYSTEYNKKEVGGTLDPPYFWTQEFYGDVSGFTQYRDRFEGYVVIARGDSEAPWPL